MKTNTFCRYSRRLTATVALFLGIAMGAYAQNYISDYSVRGGIAYYHDYPLRGADARTFMVLGYGYAKDRFNVYLNGQVLAYVDPASFRLKMPAYQPYPDDYPPYDEYYGPINYIITSNTVLFRGKKVKGAWAENFKDLGDGYARDTFHAYFMGEQINVSNSDSFQNIGDGYAKDTFHVYYLGKRIDGANPDSFKLLGNGYAEDTFHTYAYGKRVE